MPAKKLTKLIVEQDISYLVLLFIASCLICLPLFSATRIINQGDTACAFIKLVAMHQSWIYGQWTGRWIPDMYYGYGYPIFNYYPPLFSYLGAALSFLLGNMVLAFNLMIFLCVYFSGFTMYLFAKEFWGRGGAFLSAVLYLFAPFHIVQIYVLGTCAQLLAFGFFPLILLALYRLHYLRSLGNVIFLGISVAGLSLTHNCQTMLFLPIAVAYAIYLEYAAPSAQKMYSLGVKIMAIFLGLGISAYFWVPAILEKSYVHIEKIITRWFDFHGHFITLYKLLFSPWGYNVSQPGAGFSYQIGWPHCVCFMLFLCMMPLLWKKHKESVLTAIFFSLIAFAAVFMMLKPSSFIWEHISLLRFNQFPWRFLAIASFFISFVGGGVLLIKDPRYRVVLGSILLLFTVLWNVRYCHPLEYVPVNVHDPVLFLSKNTPRDNMEFLPKVVSKVIRPKTTEKMTNLLGTMVIQDEQKKGLDYTYILSVQGMALPVFHTFNFPGWEAYVDGQRTSVMQNDFGMIMFFVADGKHTVLIHFASTRIRDIAGMISCIALFILFLMVGYMVLEKSKKRANKQLKEEIIL